MDRTRGFMASSLKNALDRRKILQWHASKAWGGVVCPVRFRAVLRMRAAKPRSKKILRDCIALSVNSPHYFGFVLLTPFSAISKIGQNVVGSSSKLLSTD
ncbi:MAG: hypothetical protein ACRD2G_10470, partial [Terriglobia bacterium]